jgi:ATP-dependent RNA helicase DHX36
VPEQKPLTQGPTQGSKPWQTLAKLRLPKENFDSAIKMMQQARAHGLPTEDVVLEPSPHLARPRPVARDTFSPSLAAKMKGRLENTRARSPATGRDKLPLMKENARKALLNLIDKNDVSIFMAQTGSGKTTQVPQILLDDRIMSDQGPTARIVCTQPRRIAATSVARRVAAERQEQLGLTVGFHIRNERFLPKNATSITYCTTGILMNQLFADPFEVFERHSHIIVDEVHQREIEVDMVLTLIRSNLKARKAQGLHCPKIILMSATIDPSKFLDYFSQPSADGVSLRAGHFDIEGRSATVTTRYLPEILEELSLDDHISEVLQHYVCDDGATSDFINKETRFADQNPAVQPKSMSTIYDFPESVVKHDTTSARGVGPLWNGPDQEFDGSSNGSDRNGLVASVIAHICLTQPQGDILVFFPGSNAMNEVEEMLSQERFVRCGFNVRDESNYRLFKLHSLRRESNDLIFRPVPPGCRKIILATNIAETSITLPEVVYVVDVGKERNPHFDHSTFAKSLPFEWISKTSSLQRRGRAGRVRNGHYYALFTKQRFNSLRSMNPPRILVNDLAGVALQLTAYPQLSGARELLLQTIDPPTIAAVDSAFIQLRNLGALTEKHEITSLGRILSRFAVHPAQGKAILLGALFGCLEPMVIVASHMESNPLVYNASKTIGELRVLKRQYSAEDESDFVSIIGAFREYHAAHVAGDTELMVELQRTKSIRRSSYLEMLATSRIIHGVLADIKFLPPPTATKTVFELIPSHLNSNKDNMTLIKALLVNTVSSELAVWLPPPVIAGPTGRTRSQAKLFWTVNNPSMAGLTSRQSTLRLEGNRLRRIAKQYRSPGRLTAYSWKQLGPEEDGMSDRTIVSLDQASMITPLMAILFSQILGMKDDRVLVANDWLEIDLSAPDSLPNVITAQPARIMFELRKTLDRALGLAWLDLEDLHSRGRRQTERSRTGRRLGGALRRMTVRNLLEMLDADRAYWEKFRIHRRAWIQQQEEEAEAKLAAEQAEMETAAFHPSEQIDEDEEEDDLNEDEDDRTVTDRNVEDEALIDNEVNRLTESEPLDRGSLLGRAAPAA